MGLADGALLRWAGKERKSFQDVQTEIAPSLKFLLTWQHLAMMAPAFIVLAFWASPRIQFIGVTVFIFALSFNLSAVLQFSLQSARLFQTRGACDGGRPRSFHTVDFSLEPATLRQIIES